MGDDRTDDSVLRAVAAAPALQPPAQSPRPRRASPRAIAITVAIVAAVVAAVIAIGIALHRACIPVGEPIATWTLDADDGPHEVPVTLPGNLWDQLHLRETNYVLRTEVVLTPEQRGHTLTLSLPCFHAALALAVDGTPVIDVGDSGIGEHRFVIAPPLTDRPQLRLALSARHDFGSSIGFGVAPHLSIGVAERSPVATINRYATVVAMVLGALFAFLYGTLFLLDRRRREYLAFLVGVSVMLVTTVYILGIAPTSSLTTAGRLSPTIIGLCGPSIFLSIVYFAHLAFGLRRPPRALLVGWGMMAASVIASTVATVLVVATTVLFAVLAPVTMVYIAVLAIRVARRGEHRRDAQILLGWIVPNIASSIVETYWRTTGHNLLGGLHGVQVMYCVLLVTQTAVLVRQFAARQRTIDHTTDELRRQVAERSKQLADALATLAQQPNVVLAAGRTVGERYRVMRTLGAGGMGTVYEVERIADRKHLALKTMRDRFDPRLMARFAREGQLAAEVHHPNVVSVIDVDVADGHLYLVMELIDGGSLEQQRSRFGDAKWAKPLLAQIATGLAAIHARGIVHRDLKPANILLASGIPRIADFGLAGLREIPAEVGALDDTTPQSPLLTRIGDVFGTPGYMAPELAAGAKDAAPSADMFSFGVLAYELLVGHPPFAEPPVVARLHGRPIASIDLTGVDASVRSLLERCLDLDANQRPTAGDVASALG